jgi:Zn ribbon nucleic-acid-binding protein
MFAIEEGNIVGIACNVAGHHVRNGKVNLLPLGMKLDVIGEPKVAWDSGDCGQWEHQVKCPNCSQPAKALEGYMFWYDVASVDCEHCGYHFDTQMKQAQDNLNHIKRIINVLKVTKHEVSETTEAQLERIDKMCHKISHTFIEMEMYGVGYEDVVRAFELIAITKFWEMRECRDDLRKLEIRMASKQLKKTEVNA